MRTKGFPLHEHHESLETRVDIGCTVNIDAI